MNTIQLIKSRPDDIVCTSFGPFDGKYAGVIDLYCDGTFVKILHIGEAVHDNRESAMLWAKSIVNAIRCGLPCELESLNRSVYS
jgi:hypothetical protein